MKKRKISKSVNQRIGVSPEGGRLAELGFYTRQVQAVIKKWKGKIEPQVLESNFEIIANAIINGAQCNLAIQFRGIISVHDWPAIFEMGIAISKVISDDGNIDKWLLTHGLSCATNGEWESWDLIAQFIGKKVGLEKHTKFTELVKQRAKRLRLITPLNIANSFKEHWPGNPAVTGHSKKT